MASREVGGQPTIISGLDPQTSNSDTRGAGAPPPATQLAFSLPGGLGNFGQGLRQLGVPVPTSIPEAINQINTREQGPLAREAAALDVLLTARGRPRGNTDALPLGKDEKGNEYELTRTKSGVEIKVKPATGGGNYTLEVSGGGSVKSAQYTAQDGNKLPLSDDTVGKMVRTALTLAQQPTPAGMGNPAKAPEL